MRLRATRLSSLGISKRLDPYGRVFLADAATGFPLPGFAYTRSGPGLWCPQDDGSLKSFAANVIPREWANGRWGFRFDPGFNQLWPDPRDMSLRSRVGFNNVVPSALGPDRLTQSWSLTEDTSIGAHNLSTNPAYTASVAHTVSVVAKERAGSAKRYLLLVQTSTGFGTNLFACFDLANGASVASAGVVANTEPLADGYWRCNMVSTPTSTVTSNTQVRLSNTFAAATANYTGDGASGLDVWLTNVTNTGYSVPLVSAAGTVGNHSCSALLSALGISLGAEYSIGVDYTLANLTANYQPITVSVSDNTFNESIYQNAATLTAAREPNWNVIDGGAGQVNGMGLGPPAVIGALRKTAMRLKTNNFRAAFNGALSLLDSLGTLPDVDRVHIALNWQGGAINALQGHIHKLWIAPSRALTDAELQAVTVG